jgi:Protein of unknown function (DUF1176)
MHTRLLPTLRLAMLGLLATGGWGAPALASAAEGLHFTHLDWEVACDNTRTCRAAGYQADDAENPVSLLLTRAAGPNQPVQALVALGRYGDEPEALAQATTTLHLRVNGQTLGPMPWLDEPQRFGLTAPQLQAVLKALPRARARIEFTHGRTVWALSDQGATAVLLKMDDAQGRVGTPGALARPGNRPESQALPPLPAPVVKAARVPELPPGAAADRIPGLNKPAMAALRQALLGDAGDKRDTELLPPEEQGFRFEPLGGGQWLASTLCWRAAYNEGYCMWVVNERPPHQPRLVTEMASDHTRGVITSGQKGRGLGDCWASESWTWNGRAFVHTEASTTGQCKLIAPGGAWNLPTWVTKVVGP